VFCKGTYITDLVADDINEAFEKFHKELADRGQSDVFKRYDNQTFDVDQMTIQQWITHEIPPQPETNS
jgi:hypothetical protein